MTFLKTIGTIVAGGVVGLILSFTLIGGEGKLGGVYNQVEQHFYQGLKAGTSDQLSVNSSGNLVTTGTITGGSASVFTGTGSTTLSIVSAAGACIDTYATSSATAISVYFRYATSTAVGYNGFVTWKYGACS